MSKYAPGYKHETLYGVLTILKKSVINNRFLSIWRCYCGAEFACQTNDVIRNHTSSCGCISKLRSEFLLRKEDESYFLSIYRNIKDRCYNLKNPAYAAYGGRGILMDSCWLNDSDIFKKDIINNLGHRPSDKHQLDRIDVNIGYILSNLRWSTVKKNGNNKRNNILIKINDITKTLAQWAEISGVDRNIIHYRYKKNWPNCKLLQPIKNIPSIFDGTNLKPTFKGIRQRCNNINHPSYKDYGGRGIKVYYKWDNYKKFKSDVLEEIGPRPAANYQLDRINNNGNYEPGNLRWATATLNGSNKRNNIHLIIGDESKILSEWARLYNLPIGLIRARYNKGVSGLDLLKPIKKCKFNVEEVNKIRSLHVAGTSISELAKQTNSDQLTIRNIIRHRGIYKL